MIDRYRQTDIMTASPTGLVVKLYEGAIRNATQARVHLESGRIPERLMAIDKALAIVSELHHGLDFEQGGDIAVSLHDLYCFVTDRFLDAKLNAKIEPIDEAVQILETLLEAWQQVSLNPAGAAQSMPGAAP